MPVLSAKNRRLMFCDRIDRNERGLNQFGRQKIERDICIDRQTAKPPSELMDHQASGDLVTWFYNAGGGPNGCPVYDAGSVQDGAFPPAEAGADALPIIPESGTDDAP